MHSYCTHIWESELKSPTIISNDCCQHFRLFVAFKEFSTVSLFLESPLVIILSCTSQSCLLVPLFVTSLDKINNYINSCYLSFDCIRFNHCLFRFTKLMKITNRKIIFEIFQKCFFLINVVDTYTSEIGWWMSRFGVNDSWMKQGTHFHCFNFWILIFKDLA